MASSPQSGGGLFSRLKRGRSRLDIKDQDSTTSRISDAERSFDITPSKPGTARATPALSLPLSFSNASQSNLREDTGISKYLSNQNDISSNKEHGDLSLFKNEPTHPDDSKLDTPQKPSTSYSHTVSEAIAGMERTSSRSKESSIIGNLQSRIITEMKEKEQLIGRFEALSRVHMALQSEVERERTRAEKAEATSKTKGSTSLAPATGADGVAAGTVIGTVAGGAATKEEDEKRAKDKAELESQKSDIAEERTRVQNEKAQIERQRIEMERDHNVIEQERAEMARQREAHSSLIAARQSEKDAEVSRQSELENNRIKDRELHASQLSELESSRAKDRELHASQLSDLDARLSATNASLTTSSAEIAHLKEQNEQLRENMAKASQAAPQITDAEFVEEMNKLSHDVQNWVTNNFRKSRIDFEKLEKAGDSKELKLIRKAIPRYREAAEKAKLPFLQALVSARLMDEIWDDDFFAGMPGLVEEHETKEESGRGGLGYLREAYRVLSASNSPDFHAWRSSTVALLRRTHDPYLTANTNKLISRIAFSITNLLSSITSASSEPTSTAIGSSPLPSRVRDLQAFIAKTIDLARTFRSQRAVFDFTLPGSMESSDGLVRTASFDVDAMVDMLEEGPGEEKGSVVAAVWPLVRRVDVDVRERVVVVKSRVVCA